MDSEARQEIGQMLWNSVCNIRESVSSFQVELNKFDRDKLMQVVEEMPEHLVVRGLSAFQQVEKNTGNLGLASAMLMIFNLVPSKSE